MSDKDVSDKSLDKSSDAKSGDVGVAQNEAQAGFKGLADSTKAYYQFRKNGGRDRDSSAHLGAQPEFYDSSKAKTGGDDGDKGGGGWEAALNQRTVANPFAGKAAEAKNAAAEKRAAAEVDREHKEFANKTTSDARADTIAHNGDGDVTSIKRPDGKTTTVDYDGKHSPKEIHDADGHTWKKDGKDGNKWNVYDADGNRTESYREVKVQPDGTIVAKGDDPLGHAKEVTKMTHADGSVDRTSLRKDGSVVVNTADGSTAIARPDGSSSFRRSDGSGYDVHSNRTRTEWHPDGSRTEYDKHGKATGAVAADKGWEPQGQPDSDGTIHYKNARGDKMDVNPKDGSWTRNYADGTHETDNSDYYLRQSPPDKYGNERGYELDKKTGKIRVYEYNTHTGKSRDL